ncbi:MAG: DUF4901 domain-containing protein [Oscillospiraceae bacterium]|nr:DUF4901 domain-containing protein [Oscillospiraceae bacterium]
MKFGKFIGLTLAFTLSAAILPANLPCPANTVYAADTEKAESAEAIAMRNAIADVKKRMNIPKDFDGFDYDTRTSYDTTYYRFTWSKTVVEDGIEGTGEEITVEYYNGFINGYEYFNCDRTYRKPAFSKLTPEEQTACAKKHFYRLNPDIKGNVVFERSSSDYNLFSNTAKYNIHREEYGIGLYKNSGYITVDKDTGDLVEFSLDWWSDAVIPDASKRLSESEVIDKFIKGGKMSASYELFRKYEKDPETDESVYVPYVMAVYNFYNGENLLDAFTGEYTTMYDDKERLSYTDAYSWGRDYGDSDEIVCGAPSAEDDEFDDFSEAEKAALEKENEYISYEQALKIIKDDEFIVWDDSLVPAKNVIDFYTDDNGDNQPCRCLKFEFTSEDETKDCIYLTVKLDAYSGKIITFNKSYSYGEKSKNKNTAPLSGKAAEGTIKKAAEHFIGEKAAEYRYDGKINLDAYTESSGTGYFTRYVNGLPADFDTMAVRIDSRGEVLGFRHTYHALEFPEPKLVPENKVMQKLFEREKPSLYYTGFTDLQLTPHVYLTYNFTSGYSFNALTGERITSGGKPYYTDEATTEPEKQQQLYTDIKGHRYEKEITELFRYNVRIASGEKLNPDGAITIKEFGRLCSQAYGENNYLSYIYPDIKHVDQDTGEVTYEENPMLYEKLTLGELAKIYLYNYDVNYYRAAALEGIYAPPYKNVPQSDPNCGYIAIAKATGLIRDGEEFAYDKCISRGQCLKLMYDYISGDERKPVYKIISI